MISSWNCEGVNNFYCNRLRNQLRFDYILQIQKKKSGGTFSLLKNVWGVTFSTICSCTPIFPSKSHLATSCVVREWHVYYWSSYTGPNLILDPQTRCKTSRQLSITRIHNIIDQPNPDKPKKRSSNSLSIWTLTYDDLRYPVRRTFF